MRKLPLVLALALAPGAAAADDTALADVYANTHWTAFEHVGSYIDVNDYFEKQGIDVDAMLKKYPNPDPERIGWWDPNWGDGGYNASSLVAQAIVMREWPGECSAAYKKLVDTWPQVEALPMLQEAKAEPNFYLKVEKLRQAWVEGRRILGAAHLPGGDDDLPPYSYGARTGPMYQIALEIARAYQAREEHQALKVTMEGLGPYGIVLSGLGGTQVDENSVCWDAIDQGVGETLHRMPIVPDIKWERTRWTAWGNHADAKAKWDVALGWGGPAEFDPNMNVAERGPWAITAVEQEGDKTIWVFRKEEQKQGSEPLSCKSVGRKWENGRWEDDLACVYRNYLVRDEKRIDASEIPASFAIAAGDEVEFYIADETSTELPEVEKGNTIESGTRTVGRVRLLRLVRRAGKDVYQF